MGNLGVLRSASDLIQRAMLAARAGITFGGKRDLFEALGYKKTLDPSDFRGRYERGGLAARVVEAAPKATWRGGAEIIEDDNPKVTTQFEDEWITFNERLRVWSALSRADILAGVGYFSILLIGLPGKTDEPVPNSFKADDVKYLQPYGDDEVTITNWDVNPESERYGLPVEYQIKRQSVHGFPGGSFLVHYTRVHHFADETLDDRVFGHPRLERVWNYFDDLEKVVGSGSEAFWKRVDRGLIFDLDKDLEMDPTEAAKVKDAADEYLMGMRRVMSTRGMKIQDLGSNVSNFSPQVDSLVTLIAGSTGIPKRILVGSEQGELASTQDRENWNDHVQDRQTGYAWPIVARPFIQFFIDHKALSKPAQFNVVWPKLSALSDGEKATIAGGWADLNGKAGGVVVTPEEIRDRVLGLDPLTPKQIADNTPEPPTVVPPVDPNSSPVPPKTASAPISRRDIRDRMHGQVRYAALSALRDARSSFDKKLITHAHGSITGVMAATEHVRSRLRSAMSRVGEHVAEAHARMRSVVHGQPFRYGAGGGNPNHDEKGLFTSGDGGSAVAPAQLTKDVPSDPGYVYHATNVENLHEIASSGSLDVHRPGFGTDQSVWPDGSTEKRSYFSAKAEIVWQFAPEHGSPVVVRTKESPTIKRESTGDVYSKKPIKAVDLEYLGNDQVWHPVTDLAGKNRGAAALRTAKDSSIQYGARHAASLVTNLDATERKNVAKLVQTATDKGWTADQLSSRLESAVGLSERQLTILDNFRSDLEDGTPGDVIQLSDRDVVVPARGGSDAWVESQTQRYSRDLLAQRADMIAETALAQATSDAQRSAWQDQADSGDLGGGAFREWDGGEAWCNDCDEYVGTTAPIDGTYDNGVEGPPLHPNCDCGENIVEGRSAAGGGNPEIIAALATELLRTADGGGGNPYHDEKGLFTSGPDSGSGKSASMLHGGTVDTLQEHSVGGKLSPERAALHAAIVEKALVGHSAQSSPVVNLMGGGPASGKSVMQAQLALPLDNVHIDIDQIRTELPEFKAELMSAKSEGRSPNEMLGYHTHEESSIIAKSIVEKVAAGKLNFMVDGAGDSGIDKLAKNVAAYRAGGAKVVANYVTVDVDTAIARAKARGDQTGRYVPDSFMRETHRNVSKILPEAIKRGLFDKFTVWDTNGTSAKKIASGEKSSITIHDQAAWDKFLAKGNA